MSDLISRQAAIDAITGEPTDAHYPSWYAEKIKRLPSAQPERKTFRVIDIKTGEEADTYEIALHEEWAKNLMYCDMEGFALEEDGTLILIDECGRFEYCPIGRFTVIWDDEDGRSAGWLISQRSETKRSRISS